MGRDYTHFKHKSAEYNSGRADDVIGKNAKMSSTNKKLKVVLHEEMVNFEKLVSSLLQDRRTQ